MTLLTKYRTWESSNEIKALSHDFNLLSRWTDLYACKGKWKIEFEQNKAPEQIIHISIPAGEWNGKHTNYWEIFSSPFEVLKGSDIKKNEFEFKINQNNKLSIKLKIIENGKSSLILLNILNREIAFEPK